MTDTTQATMFERIPTRAAPRWLDRAFPTHLIDRVRNAIVIIAVFDSVATYVWLRVGVAEEGNPLVDALISTLGKPAALTVRALFTAVLAWLLAAVAHRSPTARGALLLTLAGLGTLAVWHAVIMGAGYGYLVSR